MAADMIHKRNLLCKKIYVNLTKYLNNHVCVSWSILRKYKKGWVKDKDLNLVTLPEYQALGVKWNIPGHALDLLLRRITN